MSDVQMVVCIPGPWKDRSEFIRALLCREPAGRFMFAGAVLADMAEEDHVLLEFCPADEHMVRAFEIAGQGRMAPETLQKLAHHSSVVYLHFPFGLVEQRERLAKFTQAVADAGGLAVKVESAGVAHEWSRWFKLLEGELFGLYSSCVVLIGDRTEYYSCGMHHFGKPECAVPASLSVDEAANLINVFNVWQIEEDPQLESGHTFSLAKEAPKFAVTHAPDDRYPPDDLFFNAHGVWRLSRAC